LSWFVGSDAVIAIYRRMEGRAPEANSGTNENECSS